MNEIARLPAEERRAYFEQAAAQWGRLPAQLIEKDFWVCWILRRIFALPEIAAHLTFKGGTSLSKAYQIIERFSEDVDLSVERDSLGFGGEQEPERGRSRKERNRRVKALQAACQVFVEMTLYPALHGSITSALLEQADWELDLDESDPDRQSIRFRFPPGVATGLSGYFLPSVKLELGARSDHFPVEQREIQPYLADAFPALIHDPFTSVRVLAAERTFWEKATLLHAIAHQPQSKPLPRSQSRHYYDLYQLANHPVGQSALDKLQLLDRVATHKSVFFSSASAKYDEARPGSLRLVPDADRLQELRRDYSAMAPMFFGPVPGFDSLIARLTALQDAINSTG